MFRNKIVIILLGGLFSLQSIAMEKTVLQESDVNVRVNPEMLYCQVRVGGVVSKDNQVPHWDELTLIRRGIHFQTAPSLPTLDTLNTAHRLTPQECVEFRQAMRGLPPVETIYSSKKIRSRSLQSNGLCIEDMTLVAQVEVHGEVFNGQKHLSRKSFQATESNCL